MPGYRLSRFAERDIEILLEWSHEQFGEKARIRYEALVARAMMWRLTRRGREAVRDLSLHAGRGLTI